MNRLIRDSAQVEINNKVKDILRTSSLNQKFLNSMSLTLIEKNKSLIDIQKKITNLLNSLKISSKIKLTVDVDPVNFA